MKQGKHLDTSNEKKPRAITKGQGCKQNNCNKKSLLQLKTLFVYVENKTK